MEPETINTVPAQSTSPLGKVKSVSKYLAMALVILLPFAGFWLGYRYAPEKVVEVERPVVQPTKQEGTGQTEATDGPTAGWKTYTDEARGYSFQYPSSWILNPMEGVGPHALAYVTDVDLTTLKLDREVPIDSFSVLSEFADCSSEDKPLTFAGKSATESPWGPAMVEEWRHICFSDDMAILLTADYDGNQKEVLETILSTFKFTK